MPRPWPSACAPGPWSGTSGESGERCYSSNRNGPAGPGGPVPGCTGRTSVSRPARPSYPPPQLWDIYINISVKPGNSHAHQVHNPVQEAAGGVGMADTSLGGPAHMVMQGLAFDVAQRVAGHGRGTVKRITERTTMTIRRSHGHWILLCPHALGHPQQTPIPRVRRRGSWRLLCDALHQHFTLLSLILVRGLVPHHVNLSLAPSNHSWSVTIGRACCGLTVIPDPRSGHRSCRSER